MPNNILEYLEATAARYPDKIALSEGKGKGDTSLTFSTLLDRARRIGSALCRRAFAGRRVLIWGARTPAAVAALFGAVYASACYIPLDAATPIARAAEIASHSRAAAVLCDATTRPQAQDLGLPLLDIEQVTGEPIDSAALAARRALATPEDELYIIFTSGSTGKPKGVVGCHRAVIDYAEMLTSCTGLDGSCVFGCQSPLNFDAPLKEFLTMIRCGATVYLIPRRHFSFPVLLLRFIREQGINTICWVSSALSAAYTLGALDAEPPTTLTKVFFGSEVLPPAHLRGWQNALPRAEFWQLYGPTEATGMSCYFRVERTYEDGERIPIGRPFPTTGLRLVDEQGRLLPAGAPDVEGEIYLYGDCLTHGYDGDAVRTAEAFVPLVLEDGTQVRAYRTGDIAYCNEAGDLIFVGRRDRQIKRMGHRIEPGEIEACAHGCEGVSGAACVAREDDLVLFYTGEATQEALTAHLRAHLPRYALPRVCRHLSALPLTQNGKLDRRALQDQEENL